METGFMNRITGLVIALVVGGLLVGGLLIPTVQGMTATEKTFENEGVFNASSLNANSEHTLSFDHTAPNVLVVDGKSIDMSDTPTTYSSVTVAFSDDWFARYVLDTGVILYKCGTSSASAIKGATASSEVSLNLTISNGTATFTYSDEAVFTYNVEGAGLIISPTPGEYVIKSSNDRAYVNANSLVYGVGRTDRALGTGNTSFNAMVEASVDNGVVPLYYSPQYTWNDNRTVSTTEVAAYVDLYQLSGFTFNLVDSNDVEHAITYNQIFVPSHITAEKAKPMDATQIAMFGVISILGIVALVVVAANGIRNKY